VSTDDVTLALPSSLQFRRDGDVGILELARPEKRNALDDVTIAGIGAFFAAPPAGIGAVVLSAQGENFSAGLDLSSVPERNVSEGVFHSMRWHTAFAALEFGQIPVVAMLRGAVIGGGLELAAAAHLRVAEPSAYYALPEGQRGIFVGGGGAVRLPRLIGAARVMDMILTGRVYDAAGGERIGISQYSAGAGEGMTVALELAHRIAANAPLTNFAIMHALPRIADAPPEIGFLTEALVSAVAQGDPAAKARVEDFLAKRAAKVRAH
jgi:enoyl-CoA hydratase/carnithine racemase